MEQLYRECSPAGRIALSRRAASPGPVGRLCRTCASGWGMLSAVKLKSSFNGLTFPGPGVYNLLQHKSDASWACLATCICVNRLVDMKPSLAPDSWGWSMFSCSASAHVFPVIYNKSISPAVGLVRFSIIYVVGLYWVWLPLKGLLCILFVWLLERLG